MREIKFRAWDEKFKMMNEVIVMDFDSRKVNLHPDYNHQSYFKDVVLMQYTGLKDKNGVEIYEGDILKYCFEMEREEDNDEGQGVVVFKNGMFTVEKMEYYQALSDYKTDVIGNLHENPELLK
jgi:uncharacterized phage protein (TIGR01671 family)